MRKVEDIILHCSDSAFGCTREIRQWHMSPPRNWRDVAYHFVLLNGYIVSGCYLSCMDGMIECGRYLDDDSFIEDVEIGAHCLGYNDRSIGICLIGIKNFTISQMNSLIELLKNLCDVYGIQPDNILGHCETESGKKEGKACPNFDVEDIRRILRGDKV